MPKLNHIVYLMLCFAIIGSLEAVAQGSVRGKVIDEETGEFVIGAYITSGLETVATDFNGTYIISLPAGTHELKCSFIGMGEAIGYVVVINGETSIWNVSLKPEAKILDIAVVSAGRFEQKVEEVTVSLEVLQPALVENKATTSLESAIEQTPGVSLVDGEPQIRSGSGFSYGAGSRVMVMVDDLPVLSGDAGRPTWGFLPLENLEQIEVIKGASSVLYGSAALSGVINIRTRFPDARPLSRITVQHGIYSKPRSINSIYWENNLQQSNIRFLHSRRLGGWDLVVGGNLLGDDGYKGPEVFEKDDMGNPTEFASEKFDPLSVDRYAANTQARINFNIRRRKSVIPGLKYGLSTNWQIGESLNTLIWENSQRGLYSSFEGGATRTNQIIGTVDPFVEYLTKNEVRISFRNRWQHLKNNNSNNQSNFSNVVYSELQTQKLGAFRFNNVAVTAGVVHQYTTSEAELYIGGDSSGVNDARNIAGYIQLDQPIGQRTNLSLGMRHEFFSINNEFARDTLNIDLFNTSLPVLGRPVFRAGSNFQLFEETYLRSSIGQGYRFPTIAEKYIRTSLGDLQVYPNKELLSETSTSFEFGVKQGMKLGQFMGYLDVAVFQQDYNNFIEFTFGKWSQTEFVDDSAPWLGSSNLYGLGFRSLNTGQSRIRGIETSIMGRATWGPNEKFNIDLLAGYTYTDPVSMTPENNYNIDTTSYDPLIADPPVITYNNTSFSTEGNILKYRSRHLVRFDAQFSMPQGYIGFSARYQSAHENFDTDFITLDGLIDPDPNDDLDESWGLDEWLGVIDSGIAAGELPTGEFVPYDYETGQVLEESNYKLPWIFDTRVGYNIGEAYKLSFVVSNIFNQEYAIRPLAIEAPRLCNLVFTYEIQ